MDSVANGLHTRGIHAFLPPSSTVIGGHAERYNVRQTPIMMVMNNANRPSLGLLKPKLPPQLSSTFSYLRQVIVQSEDSGNWLEKVSHLCSQLSMVIATEHQNRKPAIVEDNALGAIYGNNVTNQECTCGIGCNVEDDSEDQYLFQFYAESFSKLLQRISLAKVKMYAEICYLGNLTYHIPKIKEEDLLSCMGLRFATSHLEVESKATKHQTTEVGNLNAEDSKQDTSSSLTDSKGNSHLEEKADSSLPCGWYICDDDRTGIRYFVIQGSETIGSWQANLTFEPIQFEERDVLVHRGIYEVAKGMYKQLLPEVRAHLKSYTQKRRPLIRFTGHSLGGSVATLLNLMLLTRADAPISALLPVVTYGSPYVMCGGEALMLELGLPKDHIQGIALHRDIVPKAFSATLPGWLIDVVKAVNVNLRYNPCLDKKRLMYAPMGEFLILQPEESFSPPHNLLPPGPGLYLLTCTLSDTIKAERMVRAAQRVFLDYPYPIDILRQPSAYGWEGTIVRDHDMHSYLKCLRALIKYEQTHIKETPSEKKNIFLWHWPQLALKRKDITNDNRVTVMQHATNVNYGEQGMQHKLTNILETTTESMKGYLAVLHF